MTDFPRLPQSPRPAYDETYVSRLRQQRAAYGQTAPTPVGQFLTGAMLALVLFAFWEAFGLFIVTQRMTSVRILSRAVPALTEVDRLIALHGQELQQEAQASPTKLVALTNFPIRVTVPAGAVRASSPNALEALFVDEAAGSIYDHGAAAFAGPGVTATNATGALFSARWTVHQAFNLLRSREHGRATVAAIGLALLAALLAVLFCLQTSAYGRVVGLGSIMLGSAVAAGALTGFGWLAVHTYSIGSNDSLTSAAWTMISDAVSTMALVNGICALTVSGLLIIGRAFVAPSPLRVPEELPAPLVGPLPRIEGRRSRYE